jgi:rfaE bifunctional protein nucleotidyltransferase chain/domain
MDNLKELHSKIITPQQLRPKLFAAKSNGGKVVFSNGCFDILHRGHVEHLAKASNLGTCMVIGLNTDASVRRLKGPSRPVQDEQSRAMVLASLYFVDYVVLFDEDTPLELISYLLPDVLVKGSDYAEKDIVGADVVNRHGGEVITMGLVDGYSTTNILKKSK